MMRSNIRENWQLQILADGVFAWQHISPALITRCCRRLEECKRWSPATVRAHGDEFNFWTVSPETRSADTVPTSVLSSVDKEKVESMLSVAAAIVSSRLEDRTCSDQTEIQIVRYIPGGKFNIHRDSGPGARRRKYTVLCYLNAEYKGGYTVFPDYHLTIPPVAGRAILFPSYYLHGSLPVIQGVKYVAVGWLLSRVTKDWI